jgi:hypothetical protein
MTLVCGPMGGADVNRTANPSNFYFLFCAPLSKLARARIEQTPKFHQNKFRKNSNFVLNVLKQ